MKQAEKFNRPIITFVNTSGAYPGMEAEENGQGEAIARNLYEMSGIKVPILCLMIGEGGSGGALALSVGNEVWMMENATYSILSPEGFASILWKDGKRANEGQHEEILGKRKQIDKGPALGGKIQAFPQVLVPERKFYEDSWNRKLPATESGLKR